MTSEAAAPAERLAWADAARGLSVTLIVVLHLWAIHLVFWVSDPRIMEVFLDIITWTTPLRIPLFFFVSGYLASKSLARPWRQAWRSRAFTVAYLYVLWMALTAVFLWIDNLSRNQVSENPFAIFFTNLLAPQTHLWYLWGLVVLFLAVWFTRGLPGWAVVSAATALSVLAPFLLEQPYLQVAAAAMFYVTGARLPALTAWLTSGRRVWIFALGAAGYIVSMLLGPTGPYGLSDPLTSSIGVVATVAAMAAIADQRWLAFLRRIGRDTLPIFLLNPFVFMLLNDLFINNRDIPDWVDTNPKVAAAYAVLLLVATIALSIGIKVGAGKIGLGWLFRLPTRWMPIRTPQV